MFRIVSNKWIPKRKEMMSIEKTNHEHILKIWKNLNVELQKECSGYKSIYKLSISCN